MFGRQRRTPAAPDAKQLWRRGAAKLTGLGRDTGGAVVVLAAVMFPVLIGGMGLGAEAGYWYFTQRKIQHATDLAAHAAGIQVSQGEEDSSRLYDVAFHVATKSGFDPGEIRQPIEVRPYDGPINRHYNKDSVEVVMTETLPRLFTALFIKEPLTLTGRAVVVVEPGQLACVLSLSGSGVGIKLSGSASLKMHGCDVAANSVSANALVMDGSAKLSTRCAHVVGEAVTTANLQLSDCKGPDKNEVHEYAPRTRDPYADVEEPADQGNCEDRVFQPNRVYDLVPYNQGHPSGLPTYRFCGDVRFKGTVNFGPGLYIFSGGQVSSEAGAQLSGSNITMYLTNGARLTMDGNSTLNLAARTEDPYAGILFFADREDTGISHMLNGGAGGTFQGVVYFPGGEVTYAGGAGVSGGCTQVIGYNVVFTGNSDVASDCTEAGTRDIEVDQLLAIVE